jgi:hypothetical protein
MSKQRKKKKFLERQIRLNNQTWEISESRCAGMPHLVNLESSVSVAEKCFIQYSI